MMSEKNEKVTAEATESTQEEQVRTEEYVFIGDEIVAAGLVLAPVFSAIALLAGVLVKLRVAVERVDEAVDETE
jgi:hypothetical protein